MKKRAFTLVEMVAIITILAIIILISVPALSQMMKNSEEQEYQTFLENLYTATETYLLSDDDLFKELKQDGSISISLKDLANHGYIKVDLINPKTEQTISLEDYIQVTRSNDKSLQYQFYDATTGFYYKEEEFFKI